MRWLLVKPLTQHAYTYTLNSPINLTDPYGLLSVKDCEDIAALGYSLCFQMEDELDQIACLDDVGAAFEKCLKDVDEDNDGESCPMPPIDNIPPFNPTLPTFPIKPNLPINPPMSLLNDSSSYGSYNDTENFYG